MRLVRTIMCGSFHTPEHLISTPDGVRSSCAADPGFGHDGLPAERRRTLLCPYGIAYRRFYVLSTYGTVLPSVGSRYHPRMGRSRNPFASMAVDTGFGRDGRPAGRVRPQGMRHSRAASIYYTTRYMGLV